MDSVIVPITVFVLVYIVLTFELVNKAVVAFAGIVVLIIVGIVNGHEAVQMIDFETIRRVFKVAIAVATSRLYQLLAVSLSPDVFIGWFMHLPPAQNFEASA